MEQLDTFSRQLVFEHLGGLFKERKQRSSGRRRRDWHILQLVFDLLVKDLYQIPLLEENERK